MGKTEKTRQEDLTIKEQNASIDFKGYSMEELRYQRALMALRKEFCKTKLMKSVDSLRHPRSYPEKTSTGFIGKVGTAAGFVGKLLTKMNALDYAMVGMQLFGTGKKIYKSIKGIKK